MTGSDRGTAIAHAASRSRYRRGMLSPLRSLLEGPARRWVPDVGPELLPDGPAATAQRSIVRAGVLLTAVAVTGQSIAHLVNLLVADLGVHFLNVDVEGTLFSWASTAITFAAATLTALLAGLHPRRWRLFLGVAIGLAFLSLDDMAQLHERISALQTELGPIEHFARTFWPLVYMPLLAFVFVGLAVISGGMRRVPGTLVRVGLGLLAAAILLEMASPVLFALGLDHGDLGYELEAVIEEGAELAGWMLVTLGLGVTVCLPSPDREPLSPLGRGGAD